MSKMETIELFTKRIEINFEALRQLEWGKMFLSQVKRAVKRGDSPDEVMTLIDALIVDLSCRCEQYRAWSEEMHTKIGDLCEEKKIEDYRRERKEPPIL